MEKTRTQKVALVTGAHSGIGRATAVRLAADGHAVVCADIQGTDDTVAQIEAAGGTAMGVTLDVSKPADWDAAIAAVTERFGGVDLLAAVAGVVNRVSTDTVLELTEEAWDTVLGVNAKGIWLGMRAVIPSMLTRGGGRIVNISSLAAHKGLQGLASYTASKGAVEALTRQASVEYGRQGILVNAQKGVIQLRGQVETEEDIEALVKRTEEINGVRAVENLLHLPGTPAPAHH